MALTIGRKGWTGVGLQTGFQAPATITDYIPFNNNTLHGVSESIEIQDAHGVRDQTFSSVQGKQMGQGDFEMLLDSKFAGYLLVGALGSVQSVSLGSGVTRHIITRNNSNVPQYMTFVYDRAGIDRQTFPDVTVDQLDIKVGTDVATATAKLMSSFPNATTSGTLTTASGNIFSFRSAALAFATTVSGAANAANLKPHDLTVSIKNNTEVVHAHGSGSPRSINQKGFSVEVDFMLYFENTTDRDAYYAQTKQAAAITFTGNGIGGGFTEQLAINLFQFHFETFEIDSGLDNFLVEKVKLFGEYDNASQQTCNMTLTNTKSLYI